MKRRPGVLSRSLAFAALVLSVAALDAGPAGALSNRTVFTAVGAAAGDQLGWSVARAGDVNGDGYPDVIVGAPLNDAAGSNAGRAYVYYGGPAADATADLTFTGAAADDRFGISVASAGDFNADGYADLIVGAHQNDAGGFDAGRAYVYFGGPAADATADLTLTGAGANDDFGYSVAPAGDFNADGYADVMVGARFNNAGGTAAGRVYVYFGGPAADANADRMLTGAAAFDNFGKSVAPAGDVNGDGFGDLVIGAPGSDAGGTNSGRVYVFFGGPAADATADFYMTGPDPFGDYYNYGGSVASAGDFNGDGFGDLVVGASDNEQNWLWGGRAYVYYGGTAPDATADITILATDAYSYVGTSVASGDVNGDGFGDVVVGVPGSGSTVNTQGAYVYFGGPGADATPDLRLNGLTGGEGFGSSVAPAGDFDGDGFADLIVGAPNSSFGSDPGRVYVMAVYPYQVLAPNGGERWVAGMPATVRWRGHDPADLAISFDGGANWSTLAAQVGGEAVNERVVTVPATATEFALVRLTYTGQSARRSTSDASDAVFRIIPPAPVPDAATRLERALAGEAAGDGYGQAVANAGDVNADGHPDVIVGAGSNDAAGANAGRAYVYFRGPGTDAVADLTVTGAAAGDLFGRTVASAGDWNDDGYDDVVVGASLNDAIGNACGRAYIYHGGAVPNSVADMTLTGAAIGDQFGYSVANAGDVNGDGHEDVIIGAIGSDAGGADAGRAYVYFGGPSRDNIADMTLTGAAAGDNLGYSVAGAGDVNADGFDDVIVGAINNDAGGSNAGRAYVYFGGTAPNAVADFVLTGAGVGGFFGISVAGAGDVDGDGYDDVIVGASNVAIGASNAVGRAYLFFGGIAPDATPDRVLSGIGESDQFGSPVAGVGDVNRDGYADVMVSAYASDKGRVELFYGGSAMDAVSDMSFDHAPNEENFGTSVAGAGDANGDGFAEVVFGAPGFLPNGQVFVHDFNRYVVTSPNDDEVWNVGASQTIRWLGAEPADLWLSTDGGGSYSLLRSGVGGAASNNLTLLVPHSPTRFARVKVTPANTAIAGMDESDSLFTIQSSVALLNLTATLGEDGAEVTWGTEPAVGPQGLAGYRVYRLHPNESGNGTRVGPELIMETHYSDAGGSGGDVYRLVAVNGLQQELEVGRVELAPRAALAAWPLPYRGGMLNLSFGVSGRFGSNTGEATVELFDLSGRKVKTLASGPFASGFRSLRWDGRDDRGERVHNGIYFVRATSGGERHQLRLVVLQ